ncbi:hypothetical protein M5D96_012294, partial [Drosophila gunungcola]
MSVSGDLKSLSSSVQETQRALLVSLESNRVKKNGQVPKGFQKIGSRNHQCPEITPHDTLKESEEVCLVELSPLFEHIANQKRIEKGGEYLFNETQGVLDRIEGHQEVIRKQLMALQDRIESQLTELLDKMDQEVKIMSQKKSLEEAVNALRHSLESKEVPKKGTFHPQFEKVGSRYFYIEKNVGLDWFSAARRCREMGGHLAAPKDEDELNLIRQKLDSRRYWLDINDLPNKDEYISLASVFEHIANQKRIENGGEYLFNETQGVLDRIEDHQEVIRKQLMALQDRIEIQLKKLLDKMDLEFEKLGSRYFYIEKSVGLDWFSAARQCREMGGHLAAPKDEDELNLIRQKLDSRRYWLDINDLPNKDEYISLAS